MSQNGLGTFCYFQSKRIYHLIYLILSVKANKSHRDKGSKFTCNSKTIETFVSVPVIFDTLIHCRVFNSDLQYSQHVGPVSIDRHT